MLETSWHFRSKVFQWDRVCMSSNDCYAWRLARQHQDEPGIAKSKTKTEGERILRLNCSELLNCTYGFYPCVVFMLCRFDMFIWSFRDGSWTVSCAAAVWHKSECSPFSIFIIALNRFAFVQHFAVSGTPWKGTCGGSIRIREPSRISTWSTRQRLALHGTSDDCGSFHVSFGPKIILKWEVTIMRDDIERIICFLGRTCWLSFGPCSNQCQTPTTHHLPLLCICQACGGRRFYEQPHLFWSRRGDNRPHRNVSSEAPIEQHMFHVGPL